MTSWIKALYILVLAALPTAASSAELDETLVTQGHYYGVGWQSDGQHWSVEVVLTKHGGQVAYPSIGCTGSWSINKKGKDFVEYIEQIETGLDDCLELGLVRLETLADGRVAYTWSESLDSIVARAVLLPRENAKLNYMEQLKITLESIDFDFLLPEFTE